MDLIRAIVLELEGLEMWPDRIITIDTRGGGFPIHGYSEEEVHYHMNQIVMAGFIDQGKGGSADGLDFRCLTPKGHDFADSVRDEKIWQMTKEGALKAGGFTVSLLVDLAKGFTRKQIQKLTDVDL